MLLTSMSIPGTHETMAIGSSSAFGIDKCQTLSLEQQLDAGVRAIDIRVKYDRQGVCELDIYHGNHYQNRNWDYVVQTLEQWIRRNPTEFVLVFAQHENAPGGMPSRKMPYRCLTDAGFGPGPEKKCMPSLCSAEISPKCVKCTCSSNAGGWHGTYSDCATHIN